MTYKWTASCCCLFGIAAATVLYLQDRGRHIIESDQIGEQQLMRSMEHAKNGALIIAHSHILDAVCSCISGHLQADKYHKIGLPLTAP